MTTPLNWFIDFDDTLATGSMTWSLQSAFPNLIREYQLPTDEVALQQAATLAQERSSQDIAPEQVIQELFTTMGWPHELERKLFEDILTNYSPGLFDDARSFLERLRTLNKRVYILSNNPLAHKSIRLLEIEDYVSGVYTPGEHPGTLPKPHRSLWDVIIASDSQITAENSAFVGDDPWADGGFADNCGMACWIVDRQSRFSHLHGVKSYFWIRSLLDIPLSES